MIEQVGALPYRLRGLTRKASILLVTSRQTRRWVVPKGHLMVDKAPHEAAAIEAVEEAGVEGRISPIALGRYRYTKILDDGASDEAEVELFALLVEAEAAQWKEMDQRERRWFSIPDAAAAVEEPGLAALIRRFGDGGGPRPAA